MRLVNAFACALAAWYCLERATGAEPQSIFEPRMMWLWAVPAALWAIYAIRNLVSR